MCGIYTTPQWFKITYKCVLFSWVSVLYMPVYSLFCSVLCLQLEDNSLTVSILNVGFTFKIAHIIIYFIIDIVKISMNKTFMIPYLFIQFLCQWKARTMHLMQNCYQCSSVSSAPLTTFWKNMVYCSPKILTYCHDQICYLLWWLYLIFNISIFLKKSCCCICRPYN